MQLHRVTQESAGAAQGAQTLKDVSRTHTTFAENTEPNPRLGGKKGATSQTCHLIRKPTREGRIGKHPSDLREQNFQEAVGDRNDAQPYGEDSASPRSGSSWLGGALIFRSHRRRPQVAGS